MKLLYLHLEFGNSLKQQTEFVEVPINKKVSQQILEQFKIKQPKFLMKIKRK